MVDKFYVKYDDVHHEVESLYRQIENSNYLPDYIIAIGTGGFIPARILRSYLNIPIICITVGFYNKSDNAYGHEFKPVMVAKFPQAIKNRTDVPIIFKIRYDY